MSHIEFGQCDMTTPPIKNKIREELTFQNVLQAPAGGA